MCEGGTRRKAGLECYSCAAKTHISTDPSCPKYAERYINGKRRENYSAGGPALPSYGGAPSPSSNSPVAEAPSRPASSSGVEPRLTTSSFGTVGSRILVDPIMSVKARKATEIRSKFGDIFSVSGDCKEVDHSILEIFSDNISVAGRLSSPSSLKFFKHLGAPDFILKILAKGHHPELITPVPKIEKPNNGSFCKHIAFAIQEVKNLIQSDRVEIVEEKLHCILPLHVVVQPKKK